MPFGVFNQTLPVRYAADNQVARYVTKGGFTYDVSTKRGGVTLPVKCSILLTELGLENGQIGNLCLSDMCLISKNYMS